MAAKPASAGQRAPSAASNKPTLIVFISSVREGRNADRALAFIRSELDAHFKVRVFDPKELKLPDVQLPMHWYPDATKAPKQLQELSEEINKADAFVVLTAEYNRGVPPALTNMLDQFSPAVFAYKPVLCVSYSVGHAGGNIASALILPHFRDIALLSAPASVVIPEVTKSLSGDGKVQAGYEYLTGALKLGVSQLLWLSDTLKAGRNSKKPPKAQAYLAD